MYQHRRGEGNTQSNWRFLVSILTQITRHRVITLVPVAVIDVEVDDLVALAVAVGVLTQRTTTPVAA